MAEHLANNQDTHMGLSLTRVMEQQKVITTMHKKQAELEKRCAAHESSILSLDSSLASLSNSLKTAESRSEMKMQDAITRLDQKHQERLMAFTAESNLKISAVQRAVQSLR